MQKPNTEKAFRYTYTSLASSLVCPILLVVSQPNHKIGHMGRKK